MTTTSISITRWTIWLTRMTHGFSISMPVATSASRLAAVHGRTAGQPTECQRFSETAALLIVWTTGARREVTNGPTGITRCGNTSERTTKHRQRLINACLVFEPNAQLHACFRFLLYRRQF